MNFIRRHWYNIGGIVAIGTIIYLIFAWYTMSILQIILLLNFIAILVHQFEEYGFPGGEPAILNLVMQPQSDSKPDRYPLNQNSAMITNIVGAYIIYLIPVFFPNILWLGLGPVLVGLMQFFMHGILTNIKLKAFYNPGMGAVSLLHVPIGIFYIYYIQSSGIVTIWDWVIGIIYLIFIARIVLFQLTYKWLADKNSPYPFAEAEMKRFNVQAKLEKLKK